MLNRKHNVSQEYELRFIVDIYAQVLAHKNPYAKQPTHIFTQI